MTLSLSSHLMEQLGFRQIGGNATISAAFHSIHIYEVQGFTVDEEALSSMKGMISGASYEVAVGSSINETCRKLLDDDLADDETAWEKEHRCTPPYVLIHFGPTRPYSCTKGQIDEEKSTITTFDCFIEAREELRAVEAKVLPSLVSSLTCAFGSSDKYVRFRAVAKEVFGVTSNGTVVHDIWFVMNASGYSSTRLSGKDVEATVKQSISLATQINPRVARFFHLALQEDDLLKRFLYFFLSIEIETHAVYSSIDHFAHIASLVNNPSRIRTSTIEYFENQRERCTTLKDRFVWCAFCVWTHLNDSDIDEFRRLKKIRDDIAHGSIAAPPADSVRAAEKLAAKLQRLNP